MSLLKRIVELERQAESDKPYCFMLWRQCDGETEEEALQKYERENGHPFPEHGTILRIVRACKPNGEEA